MKVKEEKVALPHFSFDPIIGHQAQKTFFAETLQRRTLSPSTCFSGMAGVGKSRFAFLVAALQLCQNPDFLAFAPCTACASCLKLVHGNHPDLLWVASESKKIKIDTLRDVQKSLRFHAFFGRGRFVVIDGAHDLTEAAQNALLKTLESPPAGTHFILVTDQPWVLLPTVRSRLQWVRFGPLSEEHLATVLQQKGLPAEKLESVLKAAQGSVSRALDLSDTTWFTERTLVLTGMWRYLQSQGEDAVWQGLMFGKILQEKKTEVRRYLDLLQGFFRDLCVLSLNLSESTVLIHEAFWQELRLKDTDIQAIDPKRLLTLFKQVGDFARQLDFNANIELGMNHLLLERSVSL